MQYLTEYWEVMSLNDGWNEKVEKSASKRVRKYCHKREPERENNAACSPPLVQFFEQFTLARLLDWGMMSTVDRRLTR